MASAGKNKSFHEDNSCEHENLPKEVKEWDSDDVVQWLNSKGVEEQTKKGFAEQKIDGLCLLEGLSDTELHSCNVITVGEKRAIKRQIADLVGNARVKVPKLKRTAVASKVLNAEQKLDLLQRRKKVHRKIVNMFPGNNIPIFRGNASAKRRFEEAINQCKPLLNDDIGYDEEELRRHAKAILDERRRMAKHGYDYEDQGSSTSTCTSDHNDEEKKDVNANDSHESENDDEDEDGQQLAPKCLPDGVENVPLSTAETILLSYFKKGYSKELKKDIHLIPLCKKMNIKNAKSKDKNEIMMLLAKELLMQKVVALTDDANFFFLHRGCVVITKTIN